MKKLSGFAGKWVWVFPVASLVVFGCKVGPDYKPPQMPMPEQFSEINSATRPTTRAAADQASTRPESRNIQDRDYQQWWKTFGDPELNSLIAAAVKDNPDVLTAQGRVLEARANRGVVASGLFPQIGANGSYTNSRISEAVFPTSSSSFSNITSVFAQNLWQAGLDATWEIDIFGGTRRGVEAADYNIEAAVWGQRDVLVSLLGDVAVNYIQLRGAQQQLAIAQHNLQSQEQTLSLTRSKADAGLSPYLDVAQQEAEVASTAATIPAFEATIRQSIHHLGTLLGRDPGALSKELTPEGPIPVGPGSIPPGLPGDLLRRRPDVRQAERQLAEATAQIGVATADLYPQFSITGALGTEGTQFKQLFNYSSRFYDIAPGVTWDIFDAGKVISNIHVQNALQAQALQAYRKAVLQSMQDVDDSLVAFNREQVRLESLKDAVAANQRAVDLSTELFDKGSSDFLSVLDAQRSLFAAQTAMSQSEQVVSADLVALYKALGGGWQ